MIVSPRCRTSSAWIGWFYTGGTQFHPAVARQSEQGNCTPGCCAWEVKNCFPSNQVTNWPPAARAPFICTLMWVKNGSINLFDARRWAESIKKNFVAKIRNSKTEPELNGHSSAAEPRASKLPLTLR